MKAGTATSVIGHALIILWGLVSLPGAEPFEVEQVDALPVELVPIADVTAIAEGSKTAPVSDTASQQKVETPVPRPDSKRAGAAPTDQGTPITEKATDTAAAKEAKPPPPPPPPPPAPEKPPEPVKEPEPAPPEPVKEPDPPPAPEPAPREAAPAPIEELPKPTAEVAELAPKPEKPTPPAAPAPAPAVKPTAKPKPAKPIETASAEPTPPAATPKPDSPAKKPAKPSTEPPRDEPEEEFDPNQMAALLNKIDPSGGGAKASTREASLGSERETGPVAKMTQSEISALEAAIQRCWNPPIGAEGLEGIVVPLHFELNPDGSLAGDPIATSVPPGPVGQAVADAALRAVRRCAPYSFLPPEKYEHWQAVNSNFSPPAMF